MTGKEEFRARVSMFIEAPPERIFEAFVEPEWLTRFWLSKASAPLREGQTVAWSFLVEGAEAAPTATRLDPGRHVAWRWTPGEVRIDLEPMEGGTAVTLVQDGFEGSERNQADAALDATEGFAIVLCDLKTLLETGRSASLTRAKARLIEARR